MSPGAATGQGASSPAMTPPYFVLRLPDDEAAPGARFEVQVLDASGRARAVTRFDDETVVEIEGQTVSAPVLEAARRQGAGLGDYVDEAGRSVSPF